MELKKDHKNIKFALLLETIIHREKDKKFGIQYIKSYITLKKNQKFQYFYKYKKTHKFALIPEMVINRKNR